LSCRPQLAARCAASGAQAASMKGGRSGLRWQGLGEGNRKQCSTVIGSRVPTSALASAPRAHRASREEPTNSRVSMHVLKTPMFAVPLGRAHLLKRGLC
jgi:hypothetical protein